MDCSFRIIPQTGSQTNYVPITKIVQSSVYSSVWNTLKILSHTYHNGKFQIYFRRSCRRSYYARHTSIQTICNGRCRTGNQMATRKGHHGLQETKYFLILVAGWNRIHTVSFLRNHSPTCMGNTVSIPKVMQIRDVIKHFMRLPYIICVGYNL